MRPGLERTRLRCVVVSVNSDSESEQLQAGADSEQRSENSERISDFVLDVPNILRTFVQESSPRILHNVENHGPGRVDDRDGFDLQEQDREDREDSHQQKSEPRNAHIFSVEKVLPRCERENESPMDGS